MKKRRKIIIVVLLAIVMATVSVLAACFNSTTLEDGAYRIERIVYNTEEVARGNALWDMRDNLLFVVSGSTVTISGQGVSKTVEYRVRNGYLEQRELSSSVWIRENGSAASMFASTRVEYHNGQWQKAGGRHQRGT